MTSSPTSDPAVDFLADGPADAAVLILLAHVLLMSNEFFYLP